MNPNQVPKISLMTKQVTLHPNTESAGDAGFQQGGDYYHNLKYLLKRSRFHGEIKEKREGKKNVMIGGYLHQP